MKLTALKIFFALISVTMIVVTIITSLKSNFFEEFSTLMSQPWVPATLIDFYFNITILSAWVLYKEKRLIIAAVWIVLFVLLGSIATAFYVFLQLMKLKPGDNLQSVLLKNP